MGKKECVCFFFNQPKQYLEKTELPQMLRSNLNVEEASNCVHFHKPPKQSRSGKMANHLVAQQSVTVIKARLVYPERELGGKEVYTGHLQSNTKLGVCQLPAFNSAI